MTPAFSERIFEYTDAFEKLEIYFNVGLIPFYHHTEDLPSFSEFIDKIKSYKRCEIVLHGLYHEERNGQMDDFHTKSKASTEEEIRAGLEIFEQVGVKTSVFIPPCLASVPLTACLGLLAAQVFPFVLTASMRLAPLEAQLPCLFQPSLAQFHYMHRKLIPYDSARKTDCQVCSVLDNWGIALVLVRLVTVDPLGLCHMLQAGFLSFHFQSSEGIFVAY